MTYELKEPGQRYNELVEKIKSYEGWAKLGDSLQNLSLVTPFPFGWRNDYTPCDTELKEDLLHG